MTGQAPKDRPRLKGVVPARRSYPDSYVVDARTMRANGYSYREIGIALCPENPVPLQTVRFWVAGKYRRFIRP